MIRILLVHGIGISRSAGWSLGWQESIRPLVSQDVEFRELNWEDIHNAEYSAAYTDSGAAERLKVRRKGVRKLRDLRQDLGAIQSERVEVATIVAIRDAANSLPKPDETWVVAHSLGTAIVYKALSHMAISPLHLDTRVDRLITAGSPLWLGHSFARFFTSMSMPKTEKLPNVGLWVNVAGWWDLVAGRGWWGKPKGCDYHLRCAASHQMDRYFACDEFRSAFR